MPVLHAFAWQRMTPAQGDVASPAWRCTAAVTAANFPSARPLLDMLAAYHPNERSHMPVLHRDARQLLPAAHDPSTSPRMPVVHAAFWQHFPAVRGPSTGPCSQSCMQLFDSTILTAHDPSTGRRMLVLHAAVWQRFSYSASPQHRPQHAIPASEWQHLPAGHGPSTCPCCRSLSRACSFVMQHICRTACRLHHCRRRQTPPAAN